jgi:acetoin utilization protein AcuB
MFISKFMTQDVVTLEGQTEVSEAWQLMQRYRIRHFPVVLSDRTLIGIVSDRDIRSAMPSSFDQKGSLKAVTDGVVEAIQAQEIMTKDPISISLSATIQDALLLIEKSRVGAFPVVDENSRLVGIISDRDLLNAFIDVLGIKEPGVLLGIVVDEKIEEMENIIHALVSENINFGSILVHRNWSPGKRAVFPYLFTKNTLNLKRKLVNLGYEILDPVQWYLERRQ